MRIGDGSLDATWYCQEPADSRCPMPRPRLGSACSDAVECDYGTCGAITGGNAEACKGGVWVDDPVACPAL